MSERGGQFGQNKHARPETCQETCSRTHTHMCFLSGRHGTCAPVPRQESHQQVSAHSQDQTEEENQSSETKTVCNVVPAKPWTLTAATSPVPSFCPFVISNAHLFPLIKGIIIYNFLLKNQLCILSIADRNSQLVTWLEKIDRTAVWGERKGCSRLFTDVKSGLQSFLQ